MSITVLRAASARQGVQRDTNPSAYCCNHVQVSPCYHTWLCKGRAVHHHFKAQLAATRHGTSAWQKNMPPSNKASVWAYTGADWSIFNSKSSWQRQGVAPQSSGKAIPTGRPSFLNMASALLAYPLYVVQVPT